MQITACPRDWEQWHTGEGEQEDGLIHSVETTILECWSQLWNHIWSVQLRPWITKVAQRQKCLSKPHNSCRFMLFWRFSQLLQKVLFSQLLHFRLLLYLTVTKLLRASVSVFEAFFYRPDAKTCIQRSVLFPCSWCQDSPLRPVRNAGNAALCSDSDPDSSWTIKSLSFNLSKKVNYFTVNKQIGFAWEYFLCPIQNIPFQSCRHYDAWYVRTEVVHTELSMFCSPAAAPVQACRINLPHPGEK